MNTAPTESVIAGAQHEAQRQRANMLKSVRMLQHMATIHHLEEDIGAILYEVKGEIEAVLEDTQYFPRPTVDADLRIDPMKKEE